ncbi:hypothetical protein LCGC14_0985160 [marine sediment metagenome]|uniref:Uncharacterized protein n=1 Tax=marine sediment metagenome TaxID=412755 RepID=A0A0F9N7G5_9ZZZZ
MVESIEALVPQRWFGIVVASVVVVLLSYLVIPPFRRK